MKLRSIYLICKENYDIIANFSAVELRTTEPLRKMYRVSNWLSYISRLLKLSEIDILKNRCEKVINAIPEWYINENEFNLSNIDWERVKNFNNDIAKEMKVIIKLYNSMGLSTDEKIGIDIKIPPCNELSEYVSYVSELDFIFSKCPFLQSDNEKWIFDNVDVGSDWITLLVEFVGVATGVSVLLKNLAVFLDKCVIIRSHYLDTVKQKAELEKEEKDEEKKKNIIEYIERLYQKEVEKAINELEEVSGYKVENNDGDEKGRIKETFNRMGKLIDKGLQIYSTIDAPKEAQILFEPLEEKYENIEDKLKFLEKKED